MEYKYREDKTRRQVSWVAIGKVHTRYYKYSENETLPKRGELMDGVSGAYITSVSDAQEHGKPIGMMVVSAIQPLNYADDSVYSGSGTMEVRSSRMSGENESSTYTVKLYVSDSPVEAAGGETVTNDTETVPGLYFATKTVSTPRPLSDYTYSPSIDQTPPGDGSSHDTFPALRETTIQLASSVTKYVIGEADPNHSGYVWEDVTVNTSSYPGLEMLVGVSVKLRASTDSLSYAWDRGAGWVELWGSATDTHYSGNRQMESFRVIGATTTISTIPKIGDTQQGPATTGTRYQNNYFVITDVSEDEKSVPGLVFATLTYTRFLTKSEITSAKTYELEGSGSVTTGDPMRGERVFVTNDTADSNLPEYGETMAGASGEFDLVLVNRSDTENVLPGLTLVTCSYAAPRKDSSPSGYHSQYLTGQKKSKGNGIYRSIQCVYHMPDATAKAIVPDIIQAGQTYDGLRLTSYEWSLGYIGEEARVILNYSTLTAQEWMMQNINKGMLFTVPAVTSHQKLLDLDGNKLSGGSPEYPNSYHRITEGENVSFLPKTAVIIRAIVDTTTARTFDADQGKINSSALVNLGIGTKCGIYLGSSLTPIAGEGYWELTAKFLKNPQDWNTQARVTIWEKRKIWVWFDDDDHTLGKYGGWVDLKLTDNDDGVTPHPGEFNPRLLKTASFTYFDGLLA